MEQQTHPTRRLFVGATLDLASQDALQTALKPARKMNPLLRWLAPESWHLTLRFLGQASAQQQQALSLCLSRLVRPDLPTRTQAHSLCPFPNECQPSVLAVEMTLARAWLDLAGAIEADVRAIGFTASSRRLRPHMSVARFRRGKSPSVRLPSEWPEPGLAFSQVVLFESRLSHHGAHYTPLLKVPLAGDRQPGRR